MNVSKLKKVLACVLAGLMVLGCLSACTTQQKEQQSSSSQESTKGESPEETEASKKVTYPLEGNVKLTIAVVEEANVTATAENLGKTSFGQAWQKQTGVELEFITVPSNDAMGLMLAGGELPDIILAYNKFPNGVADALENGIIEPIGNYAEYMPDLMALLDENDMWRKAVSLNGTVYCAPMILEDEYLQVSSGLIIRADWLEDLGMDIPKTADDLYEVLKAFKEKKGAEIPFSLISGFFTWQGLGQGCLTSSFGLCRGDWYAVGTEIHYGYAEKEYKDVLAYFHKLYDEGLMDQNFQTVDSATVNANFMNGKTGVTYGAVGSGIGTYLDTMKDDPDFDVAGFGPLAEEGKKPMSTCLNPPVSTVGAFITTQCENKEAAAMFLNYGYTEEGINLFNFGTENESYTLVNGQPTYTDAVLNPEGITKIQALSYYTRIPQNGPFVQQKEYMEQYNSKPQQQAALACWSDTDASEYYVPSLTLYTSSEDRAELSKLMGDIETYIKEMTMRYITGLESLDTFETEYLATLEKMKVSRAIEIKQKAFDTFNAQ